MQKVFLSDRYPGWYAQITEDGHSYTWGPYSEGEYEAIAARQNDVEALWDTMEEARCLIIIKQEGKQQEAEELWEGSHHPGSRAPWLGPEKRE